MATFFIGCPMWGYKEWVGILFPNRTPASEFLRLYSRRLTTVEGNTIFYALPSTETIAHWARETPTTFRFCPKVPRDISHAGNLTNQQAATLRFVERMRGLGTRLGPIFLQLPPAFGPDQLPQLATWLTFWPTDVRLAVEVRHPDFYTPQHATTLDTLLQQHHVARVIMDTRPIRTGSTEEQQMLQARERKPNLPVHTTATTDFVFVRYIGHPRMEVNTAFLTEWAQQLADWYMQGKTIYAFCHCPDEKYSPSICYALYEQVRALVPLPTLSWQPEQDHEEPEQGRLF